VTPMVFVNAILDLLANFVKLVRKFNRKKFILKICNILKAHEIDELDFFKTLMSINFSNIDEKDINGDTRLIRGIKHL
jgi:hypothetical protein